MDVPLARTFSRPGWINLRTTLGLILFAVALLVGQRVMAESKSTSAVWVAAHDLGPNATLTTSDLKIADVHLSPQVLGRYAMAARDLSGSILSRPIAAGELLPLSSLTSADSTAEGRSMTIPITPEHAVGGQLRPGDRVDIFGTFDSGDVSARTVLLVRAVDVVAVVKQGGFAVSGDSVIGITVAVTSNDAARLAFATHNADIDVARLDGAEGSTGNDRVDAREFR